MSSTPIKVKKRRAASQQPLQIRVHVETPDVLRDPIVCSFPGGLPEALQTTTSTAASSQQPNQQHSRRMLDPPQFLWHGTRVVGHDQACLYMAATAEPKQPPRTKLCVGVYDKQTGQLKIHQAAMGGSVFCLQQKVLAYQSDVSASPFQAANSGNSSNGTSAAAAAYRALFADFGSAKKLKVLKSQDANKVTVDAVVGGGSHSNMLVDIAANQMSASNRRAVTERKAAITAAAAAAATGSGEPSSAQNTTNEYRTAPQDAAIEAATMEWRKTFLPKFIVSAKDPVDVYDAADIAGPDAWGYISRIVTACRHSKESDAVTALLSKDFYQNDAKDTWTESVKQLLDKISCHHEKTTSASALNTETVKALQHKMKCAVLLNHWIGLYSILHRKRFIPSPDATSRYFGKPLPIAERFLERFGTKTVSDTSGEAGYAMSKANKDSCVVHLLLLYLLADGGGTAISKTAVKTDDLKPLANDLKVDGTEVMHLLRQAGVTVKRNGTKIAATLTTPLAFPKLKKSAGPKR